MNRPLLAAALSAGILSGCTGLLQSAHQAQLEAMQDICKIFGRTPGTLEHQQCVLDLYAARAKSGVDTRAASDNRRAWLQGFVQTDSLNTFRASAHGPGVHANQFGQPVTLEPDGGGVSGETLHIKPNAYGLGVHMDQFGRPVREKAWP